MSTATSDISHFCQNLPEQTLRAALHGSLSTEQTREIEDHVKHCAHCAQQLVTLAEGELLITSCRDREFAHGQPRRSLVRLLVAAAAGVGIALLLRALLG